MTWNCPEQLMPEQREVEFQIREAFRGASRAGGVSWSEARAIDLHESIEVQRAARDRDREPDWEHLVDDPDWKEEPGVGGFSFVEALGFAYYLAPAMIRCLRSGYSEFLCYYLTVDGERDRSRIEYIDARQGLAIARFLRFMIATSEAGNEDIDIEVWRHAYESHWKQWDSDPIHPSRMA